jgi:hypothetical protein
MNMKSVRDNPQLARRASAHSVPCFLLAFLLVFAGCNKQKAEVKPVEVAPEVVPNDALISQQVAERILQEPKLQSLGIQVESKQGVVKLSGEVDDQSERVLASRLAGEVPGVVRVVGSLAVADAIAAAESEIPAEPVDNSPKSARVRTTTASAPSPSHHPSHVPASSGERIPAAPIPSAPRQVTTPASLNTKIWTDPIDRYLAGKPNPRTPSPLVGNGPVFESDGKQFTLDPRLLVGISAAETSFATGKCHSTPVSSTRNAWNWFYCYGSNSCGTDTCVNSPFESWQRGIDTVSKYMERNYIMKGLTDVRKIQTKYCTSGCQNWVPNVETVMREMGGDPKQLTLAAPPH